MKLNEWHWWPKRWLTNDDRDVPPVDVSAVGVLGDCRFRGPDLIIDVDYNGENVFGRISSSVNAPYLENVRRFLQEHSGEILWSIEDLDIDEKQFNIQP
jgi:hypothetical protein